MPLAGPLAKVIEAYRSEQSRQRAQHAPGRDQYQSILTAPPDVDPGAGLREGFNRLFPHRGTTPARPTVDIPGTERSLDLMGFLGALTDVATPEGRVAKEAALMAPGWVLKRERGRTALERIDEGVRDNRIYEALATDPTGGQHRMRANFWPMSVDPGGGSGNLWTLAYLGPSGGITDIEPGPRGSAWTSTSHTLGAGGLAKLLQKFKTDVPDADWLEFTRVGGLQGAAGVPVKEPLGIDLRGPRLRAIYREDAGAPRDSLKFKRYQDFIARRGRE